MNFRWNNSLKRCKCMKNRLQKFGIYEQNRRQQQIKYTTAETNLILQVPILFFHDNYMVFNVTCGV